MTFIFFRWFEPKRLFSWYEKLSIYIFSRTKIVFINISYFWEFPIWFQLVSRDNLLYCSTWTCFSFWAFNSEVTFLEGGLGYGGKTKERRVNNQRKKREWHKCSIEENCFRFSWLDFALGQRDWLSPSDKLILQVVLISVSGGEEGLGVRRTLPTPKCSPTHVAWAHGRAHGWGMVGRT